MTTTAMIQAATAHHQAGRLAEAESLYRQVLAQDPENAGVMHLLGLIAHQVGLPVEAAELIARAIRISPNALMYCNLGLAFEAQGKQALAIESFREALVLKPDCAEACFHLGAAFKLQGRLDEAVEYFRKGIEFKPDDAEAHFNLGIVLHWQEKLDAAIEHYRKAIALKPEHARAHFFLGTSQFNLGRLDIAHAEISKALELDPHNRRAMAMLAKLRKMTPEDEGWLKAALALATQDGDVMPDDAIALWFAIGKYYDDTNQYDLAFAAFRQANSQRRQLEGGLDRARLTQLVDTLITTYDADFFLRQREGCSQSERPVLIVGMPRSGTSLIEQIIATHPAAFGAGELAFWGAQSKAHLSVELSGDYDAALLAAVALDYEQLLQQHSATASRVVDKMPENFFRIGFIATVFPHARIIHARRNPVDTCLSNYFQNFNSGLAFATDLDDIAFYYRQYHRLMQHWHSVLPADRLIDVPYEDLVADQQGWSRRIIAFLGLEWDARCLDFHTTERRVGTASNIQVRQKIYQTSKARWRHYEKHLGPLLALLEIDP